MSFNYYARKVRNADLPLGTRVSALRSCIRILAGLHNESFTQAIERFDERFHFNWVRGVSSEPPPEDNLVAALNAVEIERNSLVEDMRTNALKQKAEKLPKRYPSR